MFEERVNNKQISSYKSISGVGNSEANLYDLLHVDEALTEYAAFIPRLRSWNFTESSIANGTLLLQLHYELNDRPMWFSLPFFWDLETKGSSFFYLAGGSNALALDYQVAQENRNSYANKFLGFINSPFAIFSMGLLGLFNLSGLLHSTKDNDIDPHPKKLRSTTFNNESAKLHMAFLAVSVVYFTPLLLSFAIRKMERSLNDILVDIEVNIQNSQVRIANTKLTNLQMWHRALLYSKYSNAHLKWNYYYLDAIVADKLDQKERAENSYKCALELAQAADKKVLILRGLINLYNELKERADGAPYYEEKIKDCVSQLPISQPIYQRLSDHLKNELMACLDVLKARRYTEAKEKLSDIQWDYFAEKFYPHNAVMYYQLKVALTLIGQYEGNEKIDVESRLRIAHHDLLKIHGYIALHYPDKLDYSQNCVNSFIEFIEESLQSGVRYQEKMANNERQQTREEGRLQQEENQEDQFAGINAKSSNRYRNLMG